MPKLTPRSVDWVDSAPFRIVNEVTVAGGPEDAWAVFTDNEGWPDWFPAAKECRTTSDPGTGIDATRWIHIDVFKLNERFVGWDEPRLWSFTILDANLPGFESAVERVTFEAAGEDRTRVVYAAGIEVKTWLRPAIPILRMRLDPLFKKGLAGFAARMDECRRSTT